MEGSALKVSRTQRHRDDPDGSLSSDAENVVSSLYEVHAVGFIRLAVIMLGDRTAAEDVVQDAFCGCIGAGIRSTTTEER